MSRFLELQRTLPAVPPDTKLSKLDVLVLATTYIAHLMRTLNNEDDNHVYTTNGILHPVKVCTRQFLVLPASYPGILPRVECYISILQWIMSVSNLKILKKNPYILIYDVTHG
jgi:hypothetical protein